MKTSNFQCLTPAGPLVKECKVLERKARWLPGTWVLPIIGLTLAVIILYRKKNNT